MTRFFTLFIATVAVLFGVEMLNPVQAAVIEPWTNGLARLSAWIMTAFDPDVVSQGRVLQSQRTGFGVSIEAGCNGVEAAIILIGGMLAFPAPWRFKLVGLAVGIAAVQVANLLRVISLYYLNMWNKEAFDFAHLYLWQALIMLDVLVVWLLWMRSVARHTGAGLAVAPQEAAA
ncbi:MAG: exosortase H [Burkholderiaceae bacterium]|jgi:exosortase H (IPTLxxWG-CTERM-specific)